MAHPDGTPRLIGRELSTPHGFVGKTTVGGGALLLSGEPGVGKSALLQVAAEQAAADGIRVRSNSSNDTLDVELIIRTAIASFYTDRLAGCREALDRIARDGRESGAIASALALNMITRRSQRRKVGCRRADRRRRRSARGGDRLPAVRLADLHVEHQHACSSATWPRAYASMTQSIWLSLSNVAVALREITSTSSWRLVCRSGVHKLH